MQALKKMLIKLLKETITKIETDNCEMTEEEAMDIMRILSHEALSKEQACSYLNMSRSKFDTLIRQGKIPNGRKRRGHKELVFYKDEIDKFVDYEKNKYAK